MHPMVEHPYGHILKESSVRMTVVQFLCSLSVDHFADYSQLLPTAKEGHRAEVRQPPLVGIKF